MRALLVLFLFSEVARAGDFVEESKKLSKEDVMPATILFANKDLLMLVGGRVRNEYFNLGRAQTLSKEKGMYDNQTIGRLKASWLVGIQQGRKTYDMPAIEAAVKLTHYSYWQGYSRYTPMSEEELSIRDLDNAQIGDHTHRTLMPLVFMEDAYFKINIHPFITSFKKFPTFIQAGMFPYALGRGLSLGAYASGGISHMGWQLDGGASSSEQSPLGLLLHTDITKQLALELYYTKFLEQSSSISETRAPTRMSRMEGARPERGIDKDTEAWSVKLDYINEGNKWGDLHIQPYALYARAPEQQIEMPADASTKLWTAGTMVGYKYKGFSLNMEIAGNFGTQKVHAIDRNQVILKRDAGDGKVREVYSHVFVAAGSNVGEDLPIPIRGVKSCNGKDFVKSSGFPYYFFNEEAIASITAENMPVMEVPHDRSKAASNASEDLFDFVNSDANRKVSMNGKQLVNNDNKGLVVNMPINLSSSLGELLIPTITDQVKEFLPPGTPEAIILAASDQQLQPILDEAAANGRIIVNSNIPGRKRFRSAYDLSLRGMMFVTDAAYTFEKYPFKIAATAQWIGGDAYPYNTECNKTYKGFMTLRDYNYVGMEVPLFALLYARIIPRPQNISYNKMYAYNDYDNASNLRILGTGFTWYPVKDDRQKARVLFNIASVWNDACLRKWDCNGCPNFDDVGNFAIAGGTLGDRKIDGLRDALGFKGWLSNKKASHHLGVEINWYMEYHFFPNCKLYSINGIFIPGQLYKDLRGQPNRNARRLDVTPGREDKAIYGSLGTDVTYGFHVGLRYAF